MFNLIMSAILFVLSMVSLSLGYTIENNTITIIGIVLGCLSLLWLFVSFLSSLEYYSNQQERFENLKANLNIVNLNKERQSNLLQEFKFYLGEKYPDLEEKIFSSISSNNVKILLKYPEIKSEKTLIELVKKINKLSKDVYVALENIEETCAQIRYYNNSKWEYIKCPIPEDLKPTIYK